MPTIFGLIEIRKWMFGIETENGTSKKNSTSNFFVSDLVIFCQIFLQSSFFSPQVFMKLVHIKIVFNPWISDVSLKEMILFSIVLNIFHLHSNLDQLFSTWVIVCVEYVSISVIHMI